MRTAGTAVGFDHPVMLLDERLRQRQTESITPVATRYQWEENAVLQRLRNTRTVVDHSQIQSEPMPCACDRHLSRDTCA
jgi:hypothetical protein